MKVDSVIYLQLSKLVTSFVNLSCVLKGEDGGGEEKMVGSQYIFLKFNQSNFAKSKGKCGGD